MYVTLENVFERLLEPLVLDLSDLRLDIGEGEVQSDLDYGRDENARDESGAAPLEPSPVIILR